MKPTTANRSRTVMGLLAAAVLLCTTPAAAKTLLDTTGRLEAGDATLANGEYGDEHRFEVDKGQPLVVEVTSSEFDTYLILKSPSGEQWENDDWNGARDTSRIEVTTDASGTWRLLVTSYGARETGAYRVTASEDGAAPAPGRPSGPVTMPASPSGAIRGDLSGGDEKLTSGEYVDRHSVEVRKGEFLRVDLRSTDFDTYLIVIAPSGEQTENDDFGDERGLSHVEFTASETGTYVIGVTSYQPGETGAYTLTIAH